MKCRDTTVIHTAKDGELIYSCDGNWWAYSNAYPMIYRSISYLAGARAFERVDFTPTKPALF